MGEARGEEAALLGEVERAGTVALESTLDVVLVLAPSVEEGRARGDGRRRTETDEGR